MRPRIVYHYRDAKGEEVRITVKGNTFQIGDEYKDLFKIKCLAAILNRSPITIRKWERLKVLPKAKYRSTKPAPKIYDGGQTFTRFYSREQLEMIIRVLQRHKYYTKSKYTDFSEVFAEIREKFLPCDEEDA